MVTHNQHFLVNPCGVASPPHYALATRRDIPGGATLGLLDNGKTNVSLILEQVAEALTKRFGFAEVVHLRKPAVSYACPEAYMQELLRRCAVVVNGVGD